MGMLKYRHLIFKVPNWFLQSKQTNEKSQGKSVLRGDAICHQQSSSPGRLTYPEYRLPIHFSLTPGPPQGKQNKNSGLSYINRKIKRQKRAVENKVFYFECSWLLNNNRKVRFSILTITFRHPHLLTFPRICWWNSCLCVILLLVYSSNRLQKE